MRLRTEGVVRLAPRASDPLLKTRQLLQVKPLMAPRLAAVIVQLFEAEVPCGLAAPPKFPPSAAPARASRRCTIVQAYVSAE